mmetsp:Transcript_3824/g.11811  ORF Transcript_3824/g.11811 Transcript_3824/m.11811 type:complete len:135 (-) Transcript_3824:357-761(-)
MRMGDTSLTRCALALVHACASHPTAKSQRYYISVPSRRIDVRNRIRSAWAAALASPPAGALRRKLQAARRLRPGLKEVRENDLAFRSSDGSGKGAPPLLDDFDRRLAALEKPVDESDKPPSSPGSYRSGRRRDQ